MQDWRGRLAEPELSNISRDAPRQPRLLAGHCSNLRTLQIEWVGEALHKLEHKWVQVSVSMLPLHLY